MGSLKFFQIDPGRRQHDCYILGFSWFPRRLAGGCLRASSDAFSILGKVQPKRLRDTKPSAPQNKIRPTKFRPKKTPSQIRQKENTVRPNPCPIPPKVIPFKSNHPQIHQNGGILMIFQKTNFPARNNQIPPKSPSPKIP